MNRTRIGSYTDQLGQRMVIYSELCKNYWLVEGFSANGKLLFTNERIDYWEYRPVVERFMGMPIRQVMAQDRAIRPDKAKPAKVMPESQPSLPLDSVPIHRKQLNQDEIDKEIRKLRLIVS